MKIVRCLPPESQNPCLLLKEGANLFELVGQDDLTSLLERGPEALAAATGTKGQAVEAEAVTYLPLLARPRIFAVASNYPHPANMGASVTETPNIFMRMWSSLVGHEGDMVKPRDETKFLFEGELAVIIGKGGKRIPRAGAFDHVAGFSIFNDATCVDYLMRVPQYGLAKNADATGGFGPCFFSADAVPGIASGLSIQTTLNGKVVQSGNTNEMIFDIPTLIEAISAGTAIVPGDVIITGSPTPEFSFMTSGDVVEVSIEGLGVLRNIVRDEI